MTNLVKVYIFLVLVAMVTVPQSQAAAPKGKQFLADLTKLCSIIHALKQGLFVPTQQIPKLLLKQESFLFIFVLFSFYF